MNNRGQNVNPNGTPQNHHPNQGYPQQNNQYQGNGYNGQNPQNFNRNVNNQNPYQNQNSQANNVNSPQFQGYSNDQNQPQNNMNNPQYRGQGYNAQSPQNNNMNNPQYRGQGYNGQNPQFGNNQNFKPMNRGPKMDSKIIGYITAAVAAILVVLMIFMFSSGSGKLGGRTPEEAVKNVISATKDCDFEKLVNNMYFESDEARTKARTKELEQWNNLHDNDKKEQVKKASEVKIGEVKSINENIAIVELKFSGDTTKYIGVNKVNGRWFVVDN